MIRRFIIKGIEKIRRQLYKVQYIILRRQVEKEGYVYGVNNQKRDMPQVVVSLTTYPKRFSDLDLCIKSILHQTYKPDKIIIWLGSDTISELAEKYLSKYNKYGVEYRIDNENNYYSHKKYIYAIKEFGDSIIITLDDDLIYPKKTIESLIKKYRQYPNAIIARRVHEITWNGNNINSYKKWNFECFTIRVPSNKLCATTGAGTLFPPYIFRCEDMDYELIKEFAPTADDIWLKMMAVKNNIKVVWAGNFFQMPPEIVSDKKDALTSINVKENKNDYYIKNIIKKYNFTKSNFQ